MCLLPSTERSLPDSMNTSPRKPVQASGDLSSKDDRSDFFHIIHRYVMFSYLIYWTGLSGMTTQQMR